MAKPRKPTAGNGESSDNVVVGGIPVLLDDLNEAKKRRFFDKKKLGVTLVGLLMLGIGVFVMPTKSVVAKEKALKSASSALGVEQSTTTTLKVKEAIAIPECETSPWKPDENVVGTCPGELQSFDTGVDASSATEDEAIIACANACCVSAKCVTWQYRRDVGCTHGPDVRVGFEKDGPGAYCSHHPPYRFHGQYLLPQKVREEDNPDLKAQLKAQSRTAACSTDTWNPNEQPGQCFGLGDVRKENDASTSAEKCMEACCADPKCGAWQWQKDLGCFYNRNMFTCQPSHDPIVFEPFVGRRKIQPTRTYSS